jgi:uncharacterized protein YbjT (DUF2867 family)
MAYLITGATGNVGSLVVDRLIDRAERPRVFVRDSQKAVTRYQDQIEIFVGDLENPETLKPALEGAKALLLVTVGHNLAAQDEITAKAAKAAGVARLVKLPSYDAREEPGRVEFYALLTLSTSLPDAEPSFGCMSLSRGGQGRQPRCEPSTSLA